MEGSKPVYVILLNHYLWWDGKKIIIIIQYIVLFLRWAILCLPIFAEVPENICAARTCKYLWPRMLPGHLELIACFETPNFLFSKCCPIPQVSCHPGVNTSIKIPFFNIIKCVSLFTFSRFQAIKCARRQPSTFYGIEIGKK